MEKLIELLSEYTNKHPLHIRMSEPYKGVYLQYDENFTVDIISKKFGFIKRLVDNDKIEKEGGICPRKDLVQETIIEDRETHKVTGWENKYTEEEQLLMYLSIQENPIEFLISILK